MKPSVIRFITVFTLQENVGQLFCYSKLDYLCMAEPAHDSKGHKSRSQQCIFVYFYCHKCVRTLMIKVLLTDNEILSAMVTVG